MSIILTIMRIITKIGKAVWLAIGGFIFLWIGYIIYKLQIVNSEGSVLLLAFLLMFGLAVAGIYLLITIAGKIISFPFRKKK